ncbi:hypothetical protein DMH08_35480 [Actinomadura sp. WAC 06369]|nr:hypothetical protein DMH08_35480 [Actinomadura sp. WAC 06369]
MRRAASARDDPPVTRERVHDLIPSPAVRREPPESLARRTASVPADVLADTVLDPAEPWWRRSGCALALAGRVPDGRAAELFAYVRDDGGHGLLRAAVLAALSEPGRAHSDELLAWLREQDGREPWHGADAAVTGARARLGELGTARRLAVLAADPWTHLRVQGERALDALVGVCGLRAVLAEFGAASAADLAAGGATAEERLLGVRLRWREDGDVAASLGDASTMVARQAYELLAEADGGDERLWGMVRRRAPGHLWALAVLHRRGHGVRAAWEGLGSPRVELPGVPADVRAAIVRRHVPGQRGTDPRWLVEAALLEPEPDGRAEADLRRAVRALAGAGLEPGDPRPEAAVRGTGHDTFHVVETAAGTVHVSTLGPFAECRDGRPREVLRAAGFTCVDGALAETVVEGLHVYFFGDRGPLRVRDLLFYWQD